MENVRFMHLNYEAFRGAKPMRRGRCTIAYLKHDMTVIAAISFCSHKDTFRKKDTVVNHYDWKDGVKTFSHSEIIKGGVSRARERLASDAPLGEDYITFRLPTDTMKSYDINQFILEVFNNPQSYGLKIPHPPTSDTDMISIYHSW